MASLCPQDPSFSHDTLIPGGVCPQCKTQTPRAPTPATTTTTTSAALPTPAPSVMAVSTTTTPQAPAQQLQLSKIFNQVLNATNDGRNAAIERDAAKKPSKPVGARLEVKLAHSIYAPDNLRTKFTPFTESWITNVPAGTDFNYSEFHKLVWEGACELANGMPHVKRVILRGGGKWRMVANHLPEKPKSIRILTPWYDGPLDINGIIARAKWAVPKKMTANHAYPLTLAWYPHYIDSDEEDNHMLDIMDNVTEQEKVYGSQGWGVWHNWKNGSIIEGTPIRHKRGISDVVSASERPNGREGGPLGLNTKPSRKDSVPITVSDPESDGDDEDTPKEAQVHTRVGRAVKMTLRARAGTAK